MFFYLLNYQYRLIRKLLIQTKISSVSLVKNAKFNSSNYFQPFHSLQLSNTIKKYFYAF